MYLLRNTRGEQRDKEYNIGDLEIQEAAFPFGA